MQRNPPKSCTFFVSISFHQDDQWIYCFNSSTMRWVWNKPSFHICLDYRMENNVRMAKFFSMESPSGTVEQGDIGHCTYIFIDIFIMMNSMVHNVIRKWYSFNRNRVYILFYEKLIIFWYFNVQLHTIFFLQSHLGQSEETLASQLHKLLFESSTAAESWNNAIMWLFLDYL